MECRAYAICMDSQSGGHLGQDRKVPSKAGGNLSRMHKTEKTAKESRMNYMYSHLCDTTLGTKRASAPSPNSLGFHCVQNGHGHKSSNLHCTGLARTSVTT